MESRKAYIVSDGGTTPLFTLIRIVFWLAVICVGLIIGAGFYFLLG